MSLSWILGGLVFYYRRERKEIECPPLKSYPLFSVIVPAHNEEAGIADTVRNLEKIEYPNFEVIVVNDGSTDKTSQVLNKLAKEYPKWLRVINLSPNGGKAKALNMGILVSKGELILTIDADCFINADVLNWMAWHFESSPRVGAITGNPRILNRTTLLAKIQLGEYSSIIGLIKRTQRILGKVLTVSGVIAAFRKNALQDCGFFDSDTVTEDIDITWKLQRRFWDVRFEPRALCWILTPETMKGLWRQRLRWSQGGIEVVRKHGDIWTQWRQRRLWPIHFEYIISIVWAFSLGFLIVSWAVASALSALGFIDLTVTQPFIPPAWTGSILALVCMFQLATSLHIDSRYEDKSLMKYYFWVIWYPFFYWGINAVAVFVSVFKILLRKKGVSVKWQSPDRGIHTLQ